MAVNDWRNNDEYQCPFQRYSAHLANLLDRSKGREQNAPNWRTASVAQKAQAIFDAFIEVFREKHWHYAAGSFPGLQTIQILTGEQSMQQLQAQFKVAPAMDCGRIRYL